MSSFFRLLFIKIRNKDENKGFTLFVPINVLRDIVEESADLILFFALFIPDEKKLGSKFPVSGIKTLLHQAGTIFARIGEIGPIDIVSVETKDTDVIIRIQ